MITHNISINDDQLLEKLPKIDSYQLVFRDKFQDLFIKSDSVALSELIDKLDYVNLCLFRCINDYHLYFKAVKELPTDFAKQFKLIQVYRFLLLQDTVDLVRSVYLLVSFLTNKDPSILAISNRLNGIKDFKQFKKDVFEYRNFFDHWSKKIENEIEDGTANFQVKRFLNINNQFVNFKKGKQHPFYNDVDRFLGLMSSILEALLNDE